MAIPEPGTVLECAVQPCHHPAEVTIHTPGYGPYPPLIFSVCQVCFDAFGSILAQWPKVPLLYQPTKEISREELERSLASHKDAITLSSPPTITRTHIDGHGAVHTIVEEFSPLLINYTGELPPGTIVTVNGKEIAHALTHAQVEQLRHPSSYLDDAIAFANWTLLDRLDEDLRRIEAHPASNPEPELEPEQHAPGWLPGDD